MLELMAVSTVLGTAGAAIGGSITLATKSLQLYGAVKSLGNNDRPYLVKDLPKADQEAVTLAYDYLTSAAPKVTDIAKRQAAQWVSTLVLAGLVGGVVIKVMLSAQDTLSSYTSGAAVTVVGLLGGIALAAYLTGRDLKSAVSDQVLDASEQALAASKGIWRGWRVSKREHDLLEVYTAVAAELSLLEADFLADRLRSARGSIRTAYHGVVERLVMHWLTDTVNRTTFAAAPGEQQRIAILRSTWTEWGLDTLVDCADDDFKALLNHGAMRWVLAGDDVVGLMHGWAPLARRREEPS